MNSSITVAVGLSGGVDSSLAAALLVEAGYKVVGLTMKIWRGAYRIQEGLKHACFGPGEEEDIESCSRLASSLGIGYMVIDLSAEYEARVLDYFKAEYRAGRTPNPCIVCNQDLKFGFLIDKAHEAGLAFDYFATGHYSRKAVLDGINFVKQATDTAKDQSYFLYTLDSARLERILFPLGEMTKEDVRSLARSHGLEAADKPESQDFIAGGDYAPLFAGAEPEEGDIVDLEGKILGRHRGLPFYTIGQRRGLGISSGPDPLYVIGLDRAANRVIVGPNAGLFSEGLLCRSFRFQAPAMAASEFSALAKIRQNHRPVVCRVKPVDEGVILEFETAQRAVAPGQSAVIYSEEGLVLGGGLIDEALTSP
ncbi:MAG: tRNA 2-thiouridine(34) synthase MnmA [Spirochaetes bacterium]|nr:tRNA 2-thiouridine(34) synthase MnmA [Spirochaetota bacterium]